jgi:hypothetical protein
MMSNRCSLLRRDNSSLQMFAPPLSFFTSVFPLATFPSGSFSTFHTSPQQVLVPASICARLSRVTLPFAVSHGTGASGQQTAPRSQGRDSLSRPNSAQQWAIPGRTSLEKADFIQRSSDLGSHHFRPL